MIARVEDSFDFRAPDYIAIFKARAERLVRLRRDPKLLPGLKAYYRENPIDFIRDWGMTVDPRNISAGKLAVVPFIPMPKQVEMLEYVLRKWRNNEPGIIEKSRDVGASWLAMALAVTLCLFHESMMIGVGSAKEDKLDRAGDPDTLFYKARAFLEYLPIEFRAQYDPAKDSPFCRVIFRHNGSSITGEAGDNIGRGGRKSIFFLDESAHIEHPELVDASLSATTDCRIDMSSVNGMANSFAQRRHSGRFEVFTFHYRDDLRKDEAWETKKKAEIDPIVWNAEYALDYMASVEGVIIPQAWIQSAVDAHVKLAITPSGIKRGALDVADEGKDVNAFAARHGILLTHCESWSGKGSDLFATTERCFLLCDQLGLDGFDYDADGLGAGVRGDATRIAERRRSQGLFEKRVGEYRGSAGVLDPDRIVPRTDRTALDMFANYKAQAWWNLRGRFENTHRAVSGGEYDPDNLISLSSDIRELAKLCIELSQPQWKLSAAGKILVDKIPDGMASPNLADSVCIGFAPRNAGLEISDAVLNYEPDLTEEMFGAN